jgi:hypothetical protein
VPSWYLVLAGRGANHLKADQAGNHRMAGLVHRCGAVLRDHRRAQTAPTPILAAPGNFSAKLSTALWLGGRR